MTKVIVSGRTRITCQRGRGAAASSAEATERRGLVGHGRARAVESAATPRSRTERSTSRAMTMTAP